ncbi:MAG: acyltransferase [Acidobacteria bacterium]|nr:acyltransferase [Acidobacteriota bacterium]
MIKTLSTLTGAAAPVSPAERIAPEPASVWDRLASKLSRVTSTGDLIAEIDGLRFVAIGAVLLHHIASISMEASTRFGAPVKFPRDWRRLSEDSTLVHALWQGYFGVHLFFVISGFVLALPFIRHYLGSSGKPFPSLKSYFLRRVTRIEPPYIINMTVCLALLALWMPIYWETWQHFLASLLYVHNLIYSRGSTINGVAWSLEIEVQFYILAPLIASAIFSIRNAVVRRTVLTAAIVGCAAWTQFVLWKTPYQNLKMSLLAYMQYFLAGFLLADLHQTGVVNNRRQSFLWDVLGVTGAVLVLLAMMIWRDPLYCVLPFLVLLFYVGAFQGRILQRFFSARPIVIIGGMCYTIYLYHVPIITLFKGLVHAVAAPQLPLWADFGIQVLVLTPLILVICSVLFVYTEKPFMGWTIGKKRGR